MQTFLPYTSTLACAQGLDNKRLNKQILEGYQILNILSGKSPCVNVGKYFSAFMEAHPH